MKLFYSSSCGCLILEKLNLDFLLPICALLREIEPLGSGEIQSSMEEDYDYQGNNNWLVQQRALRYQGLSLIQSRPNTHYKW